MTGQEAFDAVVDYLLGEDFYIADPVSSVQANPILLEYIKKRYMSMEQKYHICKTILKYLIYAIIAIGGFGLGCLLCLI